MDWLTLVVGVLIGGVITWVVTHLYSRRQEREIANVPQRVAQELIQRGLIPPEKEAEATTALRETLPWAMTQTGMNIISNHEFENADLELQTWYERLRRILEPKDRERLEEAQEAWRSYRDKQIGLAGGFYEGGSIRPLIHNTTALALTKTRVEELRRLYDELQSR